MDALTPGLGPTAPPHAPRRGASGRQRDEGRQKSESEIRAMLVRGFSHDVKNPLGAADGYLCLLENGVVPPASDEGRATIRRARRSLGAALDLIDDLLSLVQGGTDRIEFSEGPVDVGATVREAAEEHRALGHSKAVTLLVDVPTRLPAVRTDPTRVRQILGNLIGNAFKYTDRGSVRVSVERAARGPGGEPHAWIATHVRDSGPGIPASEVSRLFGEYSRLASDKPGTGLGLAISDRLAKMLGGTITVESTVGEGSTFSLWLPVAGAGPR